ncbi:MAG: PH domain-containing protein, partial [Oscillospiraceae bacterium]|nr:PH domain-containing protein [Oscillospiraceae bacterium]
LVRTLGQKILGVGTVTLISTDKSHGELELKNIKHPDDVRRFLSQQIETQRTKRGISSREFLGMGDADGADGEGDGLI